MSGLDVGFGSKNRHKFYIKLLSVFFNFLYTKASSSDIFFSLRKSINFAIVNLGVNILIFFLIYSIACRTPKLLSGQKGLTLKYASNTVTPKLHTSTLLVNVFVY